MPHKKVHTLAFVGGRNELRAKVKEIIVHGPFARVVLCIQCAKHAKTEDTISALITSRAAKKLEPGKNAYALIGATSVQLVPAKTLKK